MAEPPLVTIVTPTLNAAQYLAEAIESVLSQDYPRIEYIVVDGGSTDGTNAMLARYGTRLRVLCDQGSEIVAAINTGLRGGSGEICGWLSSDDTLLPGTVSAIVAKFTANPALGVVYGEGYWTRSDGSIIRRYPTSPKAVRDLWRECPICQPATFFRRSALDRAGYPDQNLRSAFDYDLWIRISKIAEFEHVEQYLATSRMHQDNRTFSQRRTAFEEAMTLQRRYFGYVPFQSVYSYCCYRLDKRDQFFQPLRRSLTAFCYSLCYGTYVNPGSRRRFLREWAQSITTQGLHNSIAEKLGRRGNSQREL